MATCPQLPDGIRRIPVHVPAWLQCCMTACPCASYCLPPLALADWPRVLTWLLPPSTRSGLDDGSREEFNLDLKAVLQLGAPCSHSPLVSAQTMLAFSPRWLWA